MQKERAKVNKISEDKIFLKVGKKKMCDCCRIAALCGENQGILEIPRNNWKLNEGDVVEIGIETKKFLFGLFMIFLVPLALFILTLSISADKKELTSFFLSLSVMILYYAAVKILFRKRKKIDIKILKKIENEK